MKLLYIILVITSIAFVSVNGQSAKTRFQRQHPVTKFMINHLNSSVEMVIRALENKGSNMQNSAIQTIRELEQLFPDESFNRFIQPLTKIIRSEDVDPETRILAVLTLDLLHSEAGDAVIFWTGKNSQDPTVRNVCLAITKMDDNAYLRVTDIK